ncbi:MAG: DUF488 family protein [Thermoleophilia bacterium]|nr:DUF488 family protein [Thermoleophilia bacterium]
MAKLDIGIKRAYEPVGSEDGRRVLVDRIWPRGVSKRVANVDTWEKELAPSIELRKWFDHDPEKFDRFRERYIDELRERREDLKELRGWGRKGRLTLVYSAKDEKYNQAVVLAEILKRGLPRTKPESTVSKSR